MHAPMIGRAIPAVLTCTLTYALMWAGAAGTAHAASLGAPADAGASVTGKNFSTLVDDYLDRFGHFHPSIAAGNGLHAHDAELENFSAASIAAELAWLHATRRDLDAIDAPALNADETVDRRILQGVIDGWVLDLATVRTWTRNPMIYVAALSDGLHNLVTMESSPAEARMQSALSKLRAVPALLDSARINVREPPKVYVERAIAMLTGVCDLLSHDLPLAFAASHDQALRQQLLAQAATARTQLVQYRDDLTRRVLPSATERFAIGTANVEARYRAEELIDLPASRLLQIGERELSRKQAEFNDTAARIDAARPALEVWHAVQDRHPAQGGLVPAARTTVDELFAFVKRRGLMDLPPNQHITVAPAPAYDLGLASMHASPPLEPHPVQTFYYITDADPAWAPQRQDAWLRAFNYATLADITAHEVVPGHYAHSLYMRRTPGKIRRIWVGLNPFPQPSSGQDGWAHYAEQMVSDEGFQAQDPSYRLAQIAESLNRICRLIAGIKLNSGEWTVAQAAALFETEGHLPPEAAAREAVRGTYDPTYGGYVLGKMAAFKLRDDYRAARGKDYSLREFNERIMTDGIAPWWAHRQLLLPGDRGAVVE